MTPTLEQRLAHRLRPAGSFVMHQQWRDLLFLHWHYDPAVIQGTLPPGLHVDTFEGRAWVAIVPFFMQGIRPRYVPGLRGVSDFLETNVRTYVHDEQGRSGVWFYSLDCNQPIAVWTARTFFSLPYQHARMGASRGGDGFIRYQHQRLGREDDSLFIYRLRGNPCLAEPGSLEFFLTERYLLFAQSPSGLRAGQVNHAPYPLVSAEVAQWDTRLLPLAGLFDPERPPDHITGSPGVDVHVFPLTR